MLKKSFIYFVGRIIKIVAHIIKYLCYIFHFIFPKKRFFIPGSSPAIIKKSRETAIPKILWQTNFTDRVTLPVYINYLFNRLMSPTFEYRFVMDEEMMTFIESNYSAKILESYLKLQIGAARADFWRVLVLQKYGGVYIDMDAHFVWFLNSIIGPNDKELFLIRKRGGYSNYFFASQNNCDYFEEMFEAILNNIEENTIKNVYYLTGPGVFNQVLENKQVNATSYRFICNQGNFTNVYFQYMDKPDGKWTREQERMDIVKK